MSIPLLCIALLAILLIYLAFTVSMARGKSKMMYGYKTDPEDRLYKAVRAHGNATEYVPIIAILIYILGTMPISMWVMWCMIIVTLSRYLAAAGLLLPKSLAKPNLLRVVGTLGTYLAALGLCVALFLKAVSL